MVSRRWLRGQSDAMVSLSAPRPLTTLGASRSMGPFDEVSRVYEDFATALTCTWRSCAHRSTPRSPELSHPTCTMRRSSQPDAHRAATEVLRNSGQPLCNVEVGQADA